MKKHLLIICGCIASFIGNAQIVNGNFENWTSISWDDLDTANTSNADALRSMIPVNVTKVTPAQNGNYAMKMETTVIGTDTNFAYALFGNFGDNGPEAGFPYSQIPSTINGYYKSNIVSGDSAGILVVFFQGGSQISMDILKIGTTQSSFTAFSFPLSIATFSVTPDSVLLVFVSSVPDDLDANAAPKHGNWVIFDNVSFGGSGITQQVPNTNFEMWSNISIEDPQGWSTYNMDAYRELGGVYAVKTTDKYKGDYALKITTQYVDTNNSAARVTNGQNVQSGTVGGVPFTNQIDTLIGYYKYTPAGADTAAVNISTYKNGSSIGGFAVSLLPAATYTYFEIPISPGQVPDTAIIDIVSSASWPVPASSNGSVLIIDEIQWKSAPLQTGIKKEKNIFGYTAFPNPAKKHIDILVVLEQAVALELSIYDLSGKLVYKSERNEYSIGKNTIRVNTNSFSAGNYLYNLSDSVQKIGSGKFIVE